YRRMIGQLVSATQLRHPGVGDLARQVRYRCFDAALIDAERAGAQQQIPAGLDRLSAAPQVPAAQIDAMVAAGRPVPRAVRARRDTHAPVRAAEVRASAAPGEAILGRFGRRHHAVMLEVMARRYSRIRPLENVRVTERSGRPLLTAEYPHDGTRYLVIATVAE